MHNVNKCVNHQSCEGYTPLPEVDYCVLCWARKVANYDMEGGRPRYVAATTNELMLVEDAIGWGASGYY